ncbi:lanC-like protein 2 isoform X3 [Narcine bancroftii]|uniref:lanC-like protein 2 isoform X3 n=1 Tax=Narcine bancroftii TaxID=1343680 RepID=UPI0038314BF7
MGEAMSKRLKSELELEERSFVNPYPDRSDAAAADQQEVLDCFDAQGKISPAFIKRIQSKIKDLLMQMEEGLKTADPHDCCTYTGWTGIALLYLQCFRATQDMAYLQRSLHYVKRTLRNLNGRRVTFLCGDAGPLAVGAVVHHKLKNETESQECIAKLIQLQRTAVSLDSDISDELLYGRAGYLYALLYVNAEIREDAIPYSVIQEPGSKVDQETLMELVKPSVDYVRHKKFRSGNYPSSLSNETDRLVHWCHGAPGVMHMLIQSYKTFKEEKYLRDATECSDVIWQRGLLRKGYGICHGTAGNGYSFLCLYKLTQDKKYLYRACKFAEWCLDYGTHGCRIPDRPYSLFEGMAGAIHFLSDILNPEGARFPALEL